MTDVVSRRFKHTNEEFLKGLENIFKKWSCTALFKTAPENRKFFKGITFISVVYSKGATIYEEREKLYKEIKMLEERPKRIVKVKQVLKK
jgi:hypothetical protein